MISEKKVMDFTKKVILMGDVAVFIIILIFIYLAFFTGGSNSVRIYGLDNSSEINTDIVELDSSELRAGKEVILKGNNKAWVNANEKYYTFELSEIFLDSGKASLYIENLPLSVIFEKDQQRNFDLDSDGYYDVSVYLKEVSSSGSSFLFKQTNKKVETSDSFVYWFDYLNGNIGKGVERQNYLLWIFYVMVIILLVFILFSLIPLLRNYLKVRKIKGRKDYCQVMKYLINQFHENKRYNQDKALRIYERIRFIYSNLNEKDQKKYKSTIEKVEKEVSKWQNI